MTLLDDLRAAERGSPELGARVLTAVTGGVYKVGANGMCYCNPAPRQVLFANDPTSSTDAAIALVESKGFTWSTGHAEETHWADIWTGSKCEGSSDCSTPPLALLAALLAAMGVEG